MKPRKRTAMGQAALLAAAVAPAVLLLLCCTTAAEAQQAPEEHDLALDVWGDELLMAAGGFSFGAANAGRGLQAAAAPSPTATSPKASPAPQPSTTTAASPTKAPAAVASQLPLPAPKASPLPTPSPSVRVTTAAATPAPSSSPTAAPQKRTVGQLLKTVTAAVLQRGSAPRPSPAAVLRASPSPSPALPHIIATTTSAKPLATAATTATAAAVPKNTAASAAGKNPPAATAAAAGGNFTAAPAKNLTAVNLPLYQKPDLPPGCSLAQWLINKCPTVAAPSPAPSLMANATAAAPYKTFRLKAYNDTCNATVLPNGDFEADKSIDATKLIGWAKIKENSTVGGGGLYNGSTYSYTGWPGPPFNGSSRYFRSRQPGNMAFVLVTNAPFSARTAKSYLSFDWFVDNPWPYWFVAQTMSINANGTDIVIHQARADLYDFDALVPPGNLSHLAQMLFNDTDSAGGAAYLGPALAPEVAASTPNLMSMTTEVPLALYFGKRLLLAFRYTTNVFYLGFGIDNVMVVDCPKGGLSPIATQDLTLV